MVKHQERVSFQGQREFVAKQVRIVQLRTHPREDTMSSVNRDERVLDEQAYVAERGVITIFKDSRKYLCV